jgi:hypothetical protein
LFAEPDTPVPKIFCSLFLAVVMMVACMGGNAYSQDTLSFFDPSPTYSAKRITWVAAGLGVTYAASMAGLYQLWYKDYDSGEFHFFDDSGEWLQVDKMGHLGSAYYLSHWGMGLFRWTGMKRNQAAWLGSGAGYLFLTTIEIFDGFSEEWGFSVTDMVFNTLGTGIALGQEFAWREQRMKIKFSYHPTDYPQYRPDLLGSTPVEQLFKDYNGQTYWLSANLKSFMRKSSKFPVWLNIAAGYGAEGMTGAEDNSYTDAIPGYPEFERYRQFYIAPDIDLNRIRWKSGFMKGFAGVFGFIKIPAPTLEIRSTGTVKYHWFYF